MVPPTLTRRQQEIYEYLREHLDDFPHPPTLDELCDALGLKSRGSLHKQIQALIESGLIEPMNNLRRGIRLVEHEPEAAADMDALPLYGYIAAGDLSQPEPFPTFADGHREILLCEAILQSHNERRWIDIPGGES